MPPLKKDFLIRLVGAGCLFGLFVWSSPDFIRVNTFVVFSLITLPITLGKPSNHSSRKLWWLLLILIPLNLLIPTKTGTFGLLLFVMLYFLGYHRVRLTLPVLIHVTMITPLFFYVSDLISFPLRIELSSLATHFLDFFGTASSAGNVIYLDGREYLVDQACAGLYMLEYGLLFVTILMGWTNQKHPISVFKASLFYAALIFLLLFSNLIRIVLLVYFHILPENWLHETIGLALFAELVLIPFYFLVTKWKSAESTPPVQEVTTPSYIRLAILSVLFLIQSVRLYAKAPDQSAPIRIERNGFEASALPSGVTQLQNEHALVYIKPPVSAYKSDHNPMICWRGSGFEFKRINQIIIKDHLVNYAELQRKEDKLYSAWWFESEQTITSDQWTWRSKTLVNQEQFYLINLTCNTRAELEKELEEWMRSKSKITISS